MRALTETQAVRDWALTDPSRRVLRNLGVPATSAAAARRVSSGATSTKPLRSIHGRWNRFL